MKNPKISIILPVYNAERYVDKAIKSILTQTYSNIEFIIINDGSTDSSLNIIKRCKDPRIILISRENKGLVESLNEGIRRATGDFIARQDADDISCKNRLFIQLNKIIQHPEIDILGGSIRIINEKGQGLGTHYAITNIDALKEEICFRGPFAHGTAFGKSSVFKNNHYYKNMWPAEDYDLWERLSRKYIISNVEEVVYKYMNNQKGISATKGDAQAEKTVIINNRAVQHYIFKSNDIRQVLRGVVAGDAKKRIVSNRMALIKLGLIPKKYIVETIIAKVRYG